VHAVAVAVAVAVVVALVVVVAVAVAVAVVVAVVVVVAVGLGRSAAGRVAPSLLGSQGSSKGFLWGLARPCMRRCADGISLR